MSKKEKKSTLRHKKRLEDEARDNEIKQQITDILEESKPSNIRELVELIESKHKTPKEDILSVLRKMEFSDELSLHEPKGVPVFLPLVPRDYFLKRNFYSIEFWINITTMLLVLVFVLTNVTSGFFYYIRYVVVSFFMLAPFLPTTSPGLEA